LGQLGAARIIASIEDPAVIKQILEHLDSETDPGADLRPTESGAARNAVVRLIEFSRDGRPACLIVGAAGRLVVRR